MTLPATPAHAKTYGLDWSRAKYSGVMPDAYYDQISICETSSTLGTPYRQGQHSSYTSSLGIHKGTALRYSGRRNLNHLTPRQLVRVADRIAFAGWTNHAGKYVWNVGPFGWGSVRHGCGNTLEYLCHARHHRAQRYKARACRLANHG